MTDLGLLKRWGCFLGLLHTNYSFITFYAIGIFIYKNDF